MPRRRDSGQLARARQWLASRTLRTRLVAGLVGLLALACATVGAVTYSQLHEVLLNQLNSQLAAAHGRYSDCVNRPPPQNPGGQPSHGPDPEGHPPPYCAQQQATAAFTAMLSSTGKISYPYLAGSTDLCHLTARDQAELLSVPVGRNQPSTVDLSPFGTYQMIASKQGTGRIVIGLPLNTVNHTLAEVAWAEVAVFLLALLITGVIGTTWVRVSLRGLRRVAVTATRVTELPLSSGEVKLPERVPDANPGTEVGQVSAAFNRMLGHVESALARREASENRLRSFAADASHELRTPLAAIRGYTELARRNPGMLPDDVAHALGRVESESARMSVLVDELLLLARLDAGRPLANDAVDMTRLVLDATGDARVAAADHRWQLELPAEPVIVRGDEHSLRQVLANLLSNAARHTPAETVVTVSLTGPHDGQSIATVTVADNGPGIPPELLPEVFERFVRGDSSRSRQAGSSGLGLAIVHAVAMAHRGNATVSSRPGETRFLVTLPAFQAGQGKSAAGTI